MKNRDHAVGIITESRRGWRGKRNQGIETEPAERSSRTSKIWYPIKIAH